MTGQGGTRNSEQSHEHVVRFKTCRGPVHCRVHGVGVGDITGTSLDDGVGVGSGAGGVVDMGGPMAGGGGGGGGLGGGIGVVTLGHTVGVTDGITIGSLVTIGDIVVAGSGRPNGTHLHRNGSNMSVSGHEIGISSGQKHPQSLKVCASVQFAEVMGHTHMQMSKSNTSRLRHFSVVLQRQAHILSSNMRGGVQVGRGVGQAWRL